MSEKTRDNPIFIPGKSTRSYKYPPVSQQISYTEHSTAPTDPITHFGTTIDQENPACPKVTTGDYLA
jgi:hypothetical protein